jgi:hypothetical protein
MLLEDCHRGAPVAGNFGLEGQETVRNPGAREPDRLFLAGWEVSQFSPKISALALAWKGRFGEQYPFQRYLCSLLWHVHYRYDGSLFYYDVYVIQYFIYIMGCSFILILLNHEFLFC